MGRESTLGHETVRESEFAVRSRKASAGLHVALPFECEPPVGPWDQTDGGVVICMTSCT